MLSHFPEGWLVEFHGWSHGWQNSANRKGIYIISGHEKLKTKYLLHRLCFILHLLFKSNYIYSYLQKNNHQYKTTGYPNSACPKPSGETANAGQMSLACTKINNVIYSVTTILRCTNIDFTTKQGKNNLKAILRLTSNVIPILSSKEVYISLRRSGPLQSMDPPDRRSFFKNKNFSKK